MNAKTVAIILLIVALGLGGGLFYRHSTAQKQESEATETIQKLTNEVTETKMKLEEQKMVNLSLERDFAAQSEDLKGYSNRLVAVTGSLEKAQNDAKASEEASKAELLKRDAKIAELESERDAYSKKMADLTSSIGKLESQISDTQKRLEASEGDRDFLLAELKRLQSEKAELERQFNDMALLREQVKRLRDEMSITRRLEWIRRGLFGPFQKGGERLAKGFVEPPAKTNYNLNVELDRGGSVRVISTLTNVPAATNVPPRK